MKTEIPVNQNDDPDFVELVSQIISEMVNKSFPEQIFVMKIDNWFDHKWLKFSGIGRVGFGFFEDLRDVDTALDEFRQDKITFPPFTPKRVIEQYYFRRDESGYYSFPTSAPVVHRRKLAPSSENLHKRVTDFAESAVFVWLSSNTKSNSRGSIMVYEVKGPRVHTWYAGLSKEEDWRVLQTMGIPREQVQLLLARNVAEQCE